MIKLLTSLLILVGGTFVRHLGLILLAVLVVRSGTDSNLGTSVFNGNVIGIDQSLNVLYFCLLNAFTPFINPS